MVYCGRLEAPWYTLYAEAMALDERLARFRRAAIIQLDERRADDADDAKVGLPRLDGQGCANVQADLDLPKRDMDIEDPYLASLGVNWVNCENLGVSFRAHAAAVSGGSAARPR